ncbi:MAG: hypothetical protein ACLT63_15610 [Bacteroides xylanisolvens]
MTTYAQSMPSLYNLQPLTSRQEIMASKLQPIFIGIIQDRTVRCNPKKATKKYTIAAPQVAEEELLMHSLHVIKAKYIYRFRATWWRLPADYQRI